MNTEIVKPVTGRHAGNVAGAEVGWWFMLRYAGAIVGLYLAVMTPVTITLALRVAELAPQVKGAALGEILGLGALVALVANPLFGQLSDRTRSRFGRRRPWLMGGMLVATLALAGVGMASSLWQIALCWCVVQAAINATLAACIAVIADVVPATQRGRISAFTGMSSNLAIFAGAAIINVIGTQPLAMFLVPAVIGTLAMLLFSWYFQDADSRSLPTPAPFSIRLFLQGFWLSPRAFPDFGWAWLSRFLVLMGSAVLMTYQVYYMTDHLGMPASEVSKGMFISSTTMGGCVVLASIVAGWFSDIYQRRKPFVLGAGIVYTLGLAILIAADTFASFIGGIVVSSFGLGIYLAVDQALVVDILPNREADSGKNMGIFNIANVLPQSLAPAIAPFFLAIGNGHNFPVLFLAAAVSSLIGAVLILKVRSVR